MSGMNTTTLPIRVINDNTIELAELATVTLTEIVSGGNTDPDVSSSMAAQINPVTSSAAVTIQANDYPHGLLTFAPSSRSVTVDEPGTGNLTSVTLTIIREYGTLGKLLENLIYLYIFSPLHYSSGSVTINGLEYNIDILSESFLNIRCFH